MSIGLHPQCKQRMKQLVADYLPKIMVTHETFLESTSTVMLLLADAVLPQNGNIQQRLERHIGEMPFTTFVTQLLAKNLFERDKYSPSAAPIPLTSLAEYSDPNELANTLVDEFESLPWRYSLTIQLSREIGDFFAKSLRTFEVCDFLRLISPDSSFTTIFPLRSENKAIDSTLGGSLLSMLDRAQWEQTSAYLQFDCEGFIPHYGSSATVEEVLSFLKAFYGLGIGLRLLKVKISHRQFPTKSRFFVHRKLDGPWKIERFHDLDPALSDTLSDLTLHDLDGQLTTEDQKLTWMQDVLQA